MEPIQIGNVFCDPSTTGQVSTRINFLLAEIREKETSSTPC